MEMLFLNMFKQIQEAYAVLGNTQKRTEYDIEFKIYSSKKITYKSYSEFGPIIEYFKSDKVLFYSGDTLRFEWKTLNADVVEIKPFGLVKPYGNNKFKLNNINKQFVNVELIATNTNLQKHVSEKLILENKLFRDARSKPGLENDVTKTTSNSTESFFLIKGRLRRKHYLIRSILLSIPLVFLLEVANATNDDSLNLILGITVIITWIIIAIQSIKRLHDINMSGWWYLLFLVPYANIVFGLYILFKNGTSGSNKYGSDPKIK